MNPSKGLPCSLVFVLTFLLNCQLTDSISVMSVDMGSEWLKVAIVKPGVPMEIALNKESRRKTPFAISMKGNEREFGDPAMSVAVKQPQKSFIYLMHLIGKKFDSPAVQTFKKRFPFYTLLKDEKRGTVLFKGEDNKKHSVEELVAMMLNNTRHTAENFANHPMKDCVLTVPVFFNQAERRALIDSANMTGLNVLQLMNDNTAVALNYGIFRASTFNATVKNIMFFDMGSSHTTVTIVGYGTTKVKDRGFLETVPQLVIKGVGFDTTLGGLEMDMRLRDYLVKSFKEQNKKLKKDITQNPRAMAKLLKESRRVRQVLSANSEHKAQIENVFEEKDFRMKVTREALEGMCADLFERVAKPIKMALDAAAMKNDDIETVILMGGGTRIPKVQDILMKTTGKSELGKFINTDESAALGAVYKAADLTAGFKVKRFIVKDLNLFPIDIQFERSSQAEGETKSKIITRNLYHRLNPLPQKKVMTFNRKPKNFDFNSSYGDLTFLNEELKSTLDLGSLINYRLSGVDEAHDKNDKLAQKGVKAYFVLDDSGLLQLEKVEAHFEMSPEQVEEEEQQTTFQKLGSKLSSFFGSGKKEDGTEEKGDEKETKEDEKTEEKDQKKEKVEKKKGEDDKAEKKEEKTEESKDKKTKDDKKSTDDKTNKTEEVTGNKTEEVKPKKPVTVKEPIDFATSTMDILGLEKEAYQASVKKLNDLQAQDLAKYAREEARNVLETHVFEFRDKLTNEDVEKLSTEAERTKITEALNKASEWLDEEGFDATEEVLKKKLNELKELSTDLRLRIKEVEERPKAIASILQSLNLTSTFVDSMKNLPDAKEIYSEKDFTEIEKIYTTTKNWLNTNWKKHNESDHTKKPVFLSKDIVYEQNKLDRELVYLINKAKYYVPKPKPKTNETKADSNSTKSDKGKSKSEDKSKPEDKPKSDDDKTEKKSEDKKTEKKNKEEKPKAEEKTASSDKQTKSEEKTEEKEKVTDKKETKKEDEKKTKKPDAHQPEDEL